MSDEPLSETSGAAARRKKQAQKKLDALAGPDDGRWANDFKKLGPPDYANPETGLLWVRKAQLLVAYQMVTTPFPSPAQRDCWKRFDNMSKAIGMTHSRSALENTVAKVRKQLSDRQNAGGTIVEENGSDVPKPATARGQRQVPRALTLAATADVPDPSRKPDDEV